MEERKTEVDLISEKPEQTGLLKYMLEKGITQFHVVKHVEEYLKEHGFLLIIRMCSMCHIKRDQKYLRKQLLYGTALSAVF